MYSLFDRSEISAEGGNGANPNPNPHANAVVGGEGAVDVNDVDLDAANHGDQLNHPFHNRHQHPHERVHQDPHEHNHSAQHGYHGRGSDGEGSDGEVEGEEKEVLEEVLGPRSFPVFYVVVGKEAKVVKDVMNREVQTIRTMKKVRDV